MKKQGFTLIEVMIAFLIAAVISTSLLMLIMQMTKTQEIEENQTSIYGRIGLIQHQFERDIVSAFVPAQTDMLPTSTEQKEQPKKLDKIFYGTSSEGGRFELLTCITSSPLAIFFGVKNAKLKPRVARVVYRLMPETQRKNSFMLTRQEGFSDLYFENYTETATDQLRPFTLIDGIQHMAINYITIEASKEDNKEKRLYKKSLKWDSAPPKEQEKKESSSAQQNTIKKDPIRLPNQIMVELALWNSTQTAVRPFTFTIPIAYKASDYEVPPETKEAAPEQPKKEEGSKEPSQTTPKQGI